MKELKFVHIPKCAGSSVEAIGYVKQVYWGKNDNELKNLMRRASNNKISFWHIPLRNLNNILLKKYIYKYDLFAIVRNPYNRCISEYFFFKKNLYNNNNFSTAEMNIFIINNLFEDNYDHDGHFIPQYKYIYDNNSNKIIKYIFKTENLDNEFNKLMIKYNLDISITNIKINKSTNLYSVNDLSTECIRKINEYYHLDFYLFGYDKIYA
jgi:hypothetical protein